MNIIFKNLIFVFPLFILLGCNGEVLESLDDTSDGANFCPLEKRVNGVCSSFIEGVNHIWKFDSPGNYTFDSQYIDVSASSATLRVVDSNHSNVDFNNGTYVGTQLDSDSNLSIVGNDTNTLDVRNILSSRSTDLIGYWRMDGSEVDSTGISTASLVGGAGFITDSKVGTNALGLDGVDDSISVTSSTHNEFTMSMWVNYTDLSVARALLDGDGDFWLDSYISNGGFPYLWSRDSGLVQSRITSTISVSPNKWEHIVFVLGSGGRKIYVNGILAAQDASDIATGKLLGIGKVSAIYGIGSMDEVAVWKSQLTTSEINTLYTKQSQEYGNDTSLNSLWTPQYSDIIAHWKLDGDWKDSSINGFHGTPTGDGIFTTEAKVGGSAVSFGGAGGKFRADSTIQTKFNKSKGTISCWMYNQNDDFASVTNRFAARTYFSGGSNDGIYLRFYSDDRFQFNYSGNSSVKGVTVSDFKKDIPLDSWTHVVATWDISGTQKLKLYLDGELVGEETQTQEITGAFSYFDFGYGTSTAYKGALDECAIWSTDISSFGVSQIYNRQKQKYSAHYDSKIIDAGASTNWSSMSWIADLPFMKELPGQSGSESSSDYSSLVGTTGAVNDNDLMNGLVGLWGFDESASGSAPGAKDIIDRSGLGNHGVMVNSPNLNKTGKFNKSISLDSADEDTINFGSNASLDFTGDFTFSSWIKITEYPNGLQDYLVSKGDYNNSGWVIGIVGSSSSCADLDGAIFFSDGDGGYHACTSKALSLNKWNHVIVRFESGTINIFLNGELVGQESSITVDFDASFDLILGKRSPNNYFLEGMIDEIALWSRALHNSEVGQLYGRGAHRVKLQARSCNDSSCNGEEWQGPSNTTNDYYFSELNNCSNLLPSGNCDYASGGQLSINSANYNFSNFTNLTIPNNRYFQYRVILESDDSLSSTPPSISSVNIGPSKYFANSPSIVTSIGVSLTSWSSFTHSIVGSCIPTYQVSLDKSIWYFHDGTNWAISASSSDSNNVTDLSSKASSFMTQLSSGTLHIKVFMNSDTSEDCSIKELSVFGK